MPELTPHEALAEQVKYAPCDERCPEGGIEHGEHAHLNVGNPLFKALWEWEGHVNYNKVGEAPEWGYVRRSREQAWYLLSAINGMVWDWQYKEHKHPLDALCAGLLAARNVKGG